MVCNKLIEQIINISSQSNNEIKNVELYKKIIISSLKMVKNMLEETKNFAQLNI